MAKTMLVWAGLDEYRRELAGLPEDCTGEATHIIEGEANAAVVAIKSAYPVVTGVLRQRVRISRTYRNGNFVTGATVTSAAPHAVIYERGTEPRMFIHKGSGAPHRTGVMPEGNVFIPRIEQARKAVVELIRAMLRRRGAKSVTGNP